MTGILGDSNSQYGKFFGILGALIFAAIASLIVHAIPRHAKRVGWMLAAIGLILMAAAPIVSYSWGHDPADGAVIGLLLLCGFLIACLAGHILVKVKL